MHTAQMTRTFTEALKRKGFRFIEVIAPCSTLYARLNKLGTGLDLMTYYRDNFEIRNKADTRELDLDFQSKIICGKFVDEERPTFLEAMEAHYRGALGDKYVPMPPEGGMLHGQD
jgi:2-oxoglutarate ferredoxin oxidoreductase subunit beta